MRMLNEFEAQFLSDLSVLKNQMNGLVGDGDGAELQNLKGRSRATSEIGSEPKDLLRPPVCCMPRSK